MDAPPGTMGRTKNLNDKTGLATLQAVHWYAVDCTSAATRSGCTSSAGILIFSRYGLCLTILSLSNIPQSHTQEE